MKQLKAFSLLLAIAIGPGTMAAEPGPAERAQRRSFPSVFQAWNRADNLPDEAPLETVARHDLIWHLPGYFGLVWNNRVAGLADGFTPPSIERARAFRQQLLKSNPDMILIAEIRYRDASRTYLPENHPWWLRDEEGRIVSGWEEGRFLRLDFHNPEFRRHVARQARAVVASGAVDGVLLDWWEDDPDRLALVREVRAAVGDDAVILANANDRKTPDSAPYINGFFMECYRSKTAEDWRRIESTLAWAEAHLREPRFNCLETWYHHSRDELNLMRATTALSLTRSDGYCLFADPNPLPSSDHLHNWYPFWNRSLGHPKSLAEERPDGAWQRDFDHGTVVYNPMGNDPARVVFAAPRRSVATGATAREHTIGSLDGDIFLKVSE